MSGLSCGLSGIDLTEIISKGVRTAFLQSEVVQDMHPTLHEGHDKDREIQMIISLYPQQRYQGCPIDLARAGTF